VISDRYPHIKDPISSSFVKSQIEYLKEHVERIYVIALSPWVPKFLSNFSFMDSKGRWDGYAKDYKYDNVEVYFSKPLALPFNFSRRRRGEDSFRSANHVIIQNKIKFDLIHAHFTIPSGYVGAKLKEAYGKKLILTVHEDHNWLLDEIVSGDRNILYSWQSADRIIRVNRSDLKEFEKVNIDRSKLVNLPNGFSPKLFKPMDKITARKMLDLPQDISILLNLAALEAYKGQEYLISAMKTVIASKKDVALYIVGKGSLRNHLQSLIDQYNLKNSVFLAGGNKSGEEIALWMNSCDLLVLPSISEGNPTVMFEALGCGKPFIGTRVGGIPEIIVDEDLGFLVDPKDVTGLAEAVLKALDRDWNTKTILDYANRFTWEKITEEIANLYQNVLAEGG
jgi:glycosyltransferase involved in cell wall biosynthesis